MEEHDTPRIGINASPKEQSLKRESYGPPTTRNHPPVSLRAAASAYGSDARLLMNRTVGCGPQSPFTYSLREGESRFKVSNVAVLLGLAAVLISPLALRAQGVLTVTPGRAAATVAGTGTPGYTGDSGPATAATLATPRAVAYDALGDLFLADTNNHVVREISPTGVITTIAGTGIEGYSGDGGAATSAQLDTPSGVAVDASGNVYIADSHNHRIREVSGGNISTVAGTGVPGFSGDGASATAAQLSLPSGIAVDGSGNLYIADTNNHRIREVSGGNISTIAGDGEEFYSGDGGAATAAALDSPTGVALDSAGNVYIADRHNQRIREVSGGTISTVAGSGPITFSGGFSGDGAASASATLAKPASVFVDPAGNLYIADTDNQRIRQVNMQGGGTAIATIAGTGEQSFGGDGGPLTSAVLNAPKGIATDASGDLVIADTLNQRLRAAADPTLVFGTEVVGVPSPTQTVTLSNTGTGPLTVSAVAFSGPFSAATSGSCPAAPITLAAGTSCTENIEFVPIAAGPASGSVSVGAAGGVPLTVLLTGTGAKATTTTTLVSSATAGTAAGQPITFTATVTPQFSGTPTGTVQFLDGTTVLISLPLPSSGSVSYTTSALPSGLQDITAVYSGDANFGGSASAVLAEFIEDFSITPTAASTGVVTVTQGSIATFNFTLAPVQGPFSIPIVLSATGLPPGATATFTPPTVTLGASSANFTMQVQTVKTQGALMRRTGTTIALALLLMPLAARLRRRTRGISLLTLSLICFAGLAAVGGLTGCGTGSGFLGPQAKTYNIVVIGTATGASGVTYQHFTTVTLTVE
jgi:sugar lactone lactonase YvrE